MKNLSLKNSKVLFNRSCLKGCSHFSLNNESETFYFAKETKIYSFNGFEVVEFELKDVLSAHGGNEIVGLKVISDQFRLFVAISTGELFLADYKIENFELVAMINGGVLATTWSPDLELCVIFTRDYNISLLTADFDILLDIDFKENLNPLCVNVNVGWGSKETQFHGSEGKKAAAKSDQITPRVAHFDDQKIEIFWRNDGQFFLVGYVDNNNNSRQFKIFSREGILHSSYNSDISLGKAICFGPNNNLITTCNYKDNIAEICFFEMNALSHGQFTIPFDNINIKKLQFNNNNSILAIFFQTISSPISYTVALYTTSNYHWCMKQCLEFGEEAIVDLYWDELARNRLYCLTANGRVVSYNWMSGYFPVDKTTATSVVIDANDLKVTPFSVVTIPPPMCAYTLHLPTPVIAVAWNSAHSADASLTTTDESALVDDASNMADEETRRLLVLTSDNGLHLFSYCNASNRLTDQTDNLGFKKVCSSPTIISSFKFLKGFITFPLAIRHLTFVTNSTIVFVIFDDDKEYLFIANMDENTKTVEIVHKIDVQNESNLITTCSNNFNDRRDYVLGIDVTNDAKNVVFETGDGRCWILHIQTGNVKPFLAFNCLPLVLHTPCSNIKSIAFENIEAIIGLSETYRLFINEIEIAQDCSSYVVSENYILWTTNNHLIKSIDRRLFYTSKVDKNGSIIEENRNVERGSRIVSTHGTKVILQMPRGNLEVIHPRVLVLHSLKIHLDKLEYMEGFKLCRYHRINMNILADHKFETFLENLKLFVHQLDTTDNINLFLTAIIKDDVTFSLYKNFYFGKSSPNNWPSKLDDICQRMQTALLEIEPDKYFISIITCDIKKSSPDLESALKRIKALKEIDAGRAVSAVKYLFFLGEAMHIYRVALSTYDLQLAVIVAEQSNMDPKEYLVELNKFGMMDENFMKYSIDLQLKKYEKALASLIKCGNDHYDECLKLIAEHKLHSKALSLYPNNSEQYKDICLLYAARLGEEKNYSESGVLYFRVGEFKKALSMFDEALRWEMCLCCASELKYDAKEIAQLAAKLAKKLVENHMNLEAATLLETYANDFEEAVVLLISGYKWDEALRLIYKYNRLDLIETNLMPSLLESTQHQVDDLLKTSKEFNTHLLRLTTVREEKSREKALECGGVVGGLASDMMSDTSSVTEDGASQHTSDSRTSKTSSKSKRSARKKKWSLRKGSANEHIALLETLHNIVDRSHKAMLEDVKKLTDTLLLFGKESLALELQNEMSNLFETIEKSMDTIWLPQSQVQDSNYNFGPNSTSNSISSSLANKSDLNNLNIKSDINFKDMPFMMRPIIKTITWKNIIINNLPKL